MLETEKLAQYYIILAGPLSTETSNNESFHTNQDHAKILGFVPFFVRERVPRSGKTRSSDKRNPISAPSACSQSISTCCR